MVEQKFCLEQIFPLHMRKQLGIEKWQENLEEIRIRVGQPIELIHSTGTACLNVCDGICTLVPWRECKKEELYRVTMQDLAEMINYISNYSLYAYKDEIRHGYITIEGGHRVGMAGGAVMEHGELVSLQSISFLNIRVAHEYKGCADWVIPYICKEEGIYNTLFYSEPGAGKTTLLRDCIRLLSNGTDEREGMKVCVVDERSEIAACHIGVPQNDLGYRTDVLCGCAKAVGIQMLLRAMSPQVLAVDELGGEEDFHAVEQAVYSGCHVLGTIHAGNISELCKKPYLAELIRHGVFQRYIGIRRGKEGARSYQIFDAEMESLC